MLSPPQLATLRAAVDRVIPADDHPGGWEAGVGDYLLGQFDRDLAPLVPAYRHGLDALDAEAEAVWGAPFAGLNPAWQDALLARVEAGKTSPSVAWPVEPVLFFRRLVEHCMEGFYSDQGNGGNKDGVAWDMIGFEVRG
jgi:gluconate 2-dehydrogenase gamma chain